MSDPVILNSFEPFGIAHLCVIGITVSLCVLLPVVSRRSGSKRLTQSICWMLAVFLIFSEVVRALYVLTQKGWEPFLAEGLPLHACGLALYLSAVVLLTRRQLLYEVTFFWGMAGTVQAIVTPAVETGFPSWPFVLFFMGHVGIVVSVMFATFGLGLRPRLKGMWLTYALSWCMAGVVGVANLLLGSNYMYLCEPPTGQSPFYFLPWPWYILFQGVLALVLFVLLWLPFTLQKRKSPL